MTLEEMLNHINKIIDLQPRRKDLEVRIPIQEERVGPMPSVGIKAMHAGIDWDSGSFFLYPTDALQYADRQPLYEDDRQFYKRVKDEDNQTVRNIKIGRERHAQRVEQLIKDTDFGELTHQQLKDLERILEPVNQTKEDGQ